MTKLNVKIKEFIEAVSESGRYTIRGATEKQDSQYPAVLLELVKNNNGVKYRQFIPKNIANDNEVKLNTNLGRLVQAWTDETERWLGKQIDIKIDERDRRHVYPVIE